MNEHGVVKYEYDARGNTIRKIQMQGNQKRQEFMYEYDSENRLIKVLHKNYKLLEKVKGTEAADIAETEIRYYYNASGMRVAVQKPNKSLISKISNSKSSNSQFKNCLTTALSSIFCLLRFSERFNRPKFVLLYL